MASSFAKGLMLRCLKAGELCRKGAVFAMNYSPIGVVFLMNYSPIGAVFLMNYSPI
jgi:hypothetical protein